LDGRVQAILIQPQEKVANLNDPVGIKFINDLSHYLDSFVIITLADQVGEVDDLMAVARANGAALLEAFRKYKPRSLVALGPWMSKFLVPSIGKWENYEIQWSIHTFDYGMGSVPVHCFPTYRAIYARVEDFLFLGENLTKVRFLINNPYHLKGEEINLDTFKLVKEYLDFLRYEHAGPVGLDTETGNLNYAHNTQLASIQFAHDPNHGYVLLRQHDDNPFSIDENAQIDQMVHDLLDDGSSKISYWTLHNAQFDNAQFYCKYHVMPRRPVVDTMLGMHFLDSARKDRVYTMRGQAPNGLKQLVVEFLGFHHYDQEMLDARKDGTLLGLPLPKFVSYSGMDPYATLRGLHALIAQARNLGIENEFMTMLLVSDSRKTKCYSAMTHFGMMADLRHLIQLGSPASPILKRVRDISTELKKDPVCQAVNRELLTNSVGVQTTFTMPWVLDLNSHTHKTALFFTSDNGFKYPANDEGNYSADSDFQEENIGNPVVALFSEYQGLQKLDSSYIRKFNASFTNPGKTDYVDGRIHGKFLLHGTQTGRLSCIAKGTLVEIVRNLNLNPKGIPIEQVQVGDIAYCLTSDNKPTLSRVTKAWQTGVREIIRLHWKSGHTGKSVNYGYLDLTDDHLVKTVDQGWVPASALAVGTSVYALQRIRKGSLLFTGVHEEYADHRFVFEHANKVKIPKGYHIHHKDWDHYNNNPSNLSMLTAHEHISYHTAILKNTVPNNHKIIRVERLNVSVPVYDITVEDHHNFFAGELCVHNCVDPNMQQVPRGDGIEKKAIKNIFIAPPGKVIFQADFCAAEVRMWAEMSRDPGLVQNFIDAYAMKCAFLKDPQPEIKAKSDAMSDIHVQNARLMFGVPEGQKVEKTLRTATKSITFGLMYVRGTPSIAAQIGKTVEETEELCQSFYSKFSVGKAWLDDRVEFAKAHGYVETFFGRRRWLRNVYSNNRSLMQRDFRRAVNTPIQSATGDYASLATSLLFEELYNQGVHEVYKLVNAVHDSVLIECPNTAEDLRYIARLTRYIFVTKTPQVIEELFGHKMSVPLDIDMDVSQGKQWVCKHCGTAYQWSEHPTICTKKKKTTNADGTTEEVPCGCAEFKEKHLSHGWSSCVGLDESDPSFDEVAEGF